MFAGGQARRALSPLREPGSNVRSTAGQPVLTPSGGRTSHLLFSPEPQVRFPSAPSSSSSFSYQCQRDECVKLLLPGRSFLHSWQVGCTPVGGIQGFCLQAGGRTPAQAWLRAGFRGAGRRGRGLSQEPLKIQRLCIFYWSWFHTDILLHCYFRLALTVPFCLHYHGRN